MTYDEIMREISAGLTGDTEKDTVYLKEQMEKYKEHELAKDIVRACGRLFYELIPEDKKKELAQVIDNDMSGIHAVLDEVKFNVFKKDFGRALELMENLVEKTENIKIDIDIVPQRDYNYRQKRTVTKYVTASYNVVLDDTIEFKMLGGVFLHFKRKTHGKLYDISTNCG